MTQDTGAIRGLVISPSITPIPDATVSLNGANLTKKTSATGSFSFNKLKPGTYFIEASKIGYSKVQTSTVVIAGDENPPVVKIQLVEDSVNRPFAEMLNWKGFINCGGSVSSPVTYVGGDLCSPTPVTQGDDVRHDFPFSAGIPTFSQSEMTWTGSQPTGKDLTLTYYLSGTTDWKGASGASPVTLNTTHDEIVAKAPKKADSTVLTQRVFPRTDFTSLGPQVVLNQDFKVFVTHFYNFRPHAGWTFFKDGECLKPEQCA